MRPKEFAELLKIAIPHKEPILVTGAPGIGKTDIIIQACKDLKARLIITHPVVSDPTDFKGLPFMAIENGETIAKFLPFNDLLDLINTTDLTVFFGDDMGQAPSSVQASWMQLALARRINGHIVSDDVVFMAATNRRQDKAGVQGILEPLKGRFTIVELTPDNKDWYEWANKNAMPPELIAFVRFRESNHHNILWDFKPTLDMTNSPNPRNWATVGRWMNLKLPAGLEFETYSGRVGAAATELLAFIKIYRNLPDIDFVIANPEKAEIPKEISVMFALLGAMAHRATEKNFGNVVKFANRLPAEYAVLLVKDTVIKYPKLINTSAFQEFIMHHKDII
jgi:hypothetical protein